MCATAIEVHKPSEARIRGQLRRFWSDARRNYLAVTSLGIIALAVVLLITLRTVWPAMLLATYGLDDKVAVALFSGICVLLSVSLLVHPFVCTLGEGKRAGLKS
jgi:hypothetical protein